VPGYPVGNRIELGRVGQQRHVGENDSRFRRVGPSSAIDVDGTAVVHSAPQPVDMGGRDSMTSRNYTDAIRYRICRAFDHVGGHWSMQSAHAAAGTGDAEESGDGLSRRDREILAFERQWWKYAGAKEQAIRELFDMSATRYYQVLNALIDTPAALAADPMLVKRLRRLRASRQRQRSARRLGIEV
jgi:hypothetical protein